MDITDLSGMGKPLEKFLDVISKGIGRVYQDTIGIKTEVNRYKSMEVAKVEIENLKKEGLSEIKDRTLSRILYVEEKRQRNLESVLSLSYAHLPEKVSDKDVEENWLTKYFESIKDVSNEEMKIVWAKILTGELETPGRFSLRTLDVLKYITADEALIFQRLCEITSGFNYIIRPYYSGYDLISKRERQGSECDCDAPPAGA